MRRPVNRSKSKREFNGRQAKTHKKNLHFGFRGGVRL